MYCGGGHYIEVTLYRKDYLKLLHQMALANNIGTLLETMLAHLFAIFVEPLSNWVKFSDRLIGVVVFGIRRPRLLANKLRHRLIAKKREKTTGEA